MAFDDSSSSTKKKISSIVSANKGYDNAIAARDDTAGVDNDVGRGDDGESRADDRSGEGVSGGHDGSVANKVTIVTGDDTAKEELVRDDTEEQPVEGTTEERLEKSDVQVGTDTTEQAGQKEGDEQPPNERGADQPPKERGADQPPKEGGADQLPKEEQTDLPPKDGGVDQLPKDGGADQPPMEDGEPSKEIDTNDGASELKGIEEMKEQDSGKEVAMGKELTHETGDNTDWCSSDLPTPESRLTDLSEGTKDTDNIPVHSDIVVEDEVEGSEEDRKALMEEIMREIEEKNRLMSLNEQVQQRIAECLAKRKIEERGDPGRVTIDHEKKYMHTMGNIDELRSEMEEFEQENMLEEAKLIALKDERLAELKQARDGFMEYRKKCLLNILDTRTGKRITATDIDYYHNLEEEKEVEIVQIRLENIKLLNKLSKLEASLRKKGQLQPSNSHIEDSTNQTADILVKDQLQPPLDLVTVCQKEERSPQSKKQKEPVSFVLFVIQQDQLAEGLHMIDFEQLKINNIDLNEKIEERNDDILKLKKKVTSTIQVLTHVKEKLQFLQAVIAQRKAVLNEIETDLAMKRDELTHLKQAHDAIRADNLHLKQKGGLVGHMALLRDYEERQDQSRDMRQRLEVLQKRHSELSVMCNGFKKRIEKAKLLQAQAR